MLQFQLALALRPVQNWDSCASRDSQGTCYGGEETTIFYHCTTTLNVSNPAYGLTQMYISTADLAGQVRAAEAQNNVIYNEIDGNAKQATWISVIKKSAVANAPTTYITTLGAVFTQVQGPGSFGKAWKDPSGTIWGAYLGDYLNTAIKPDQNNLVVDSAATEACAKMGGNLPTYYQFSQLAFYFDQNQNGVLRDRGRNDWDAIFPEVLDPNYRNREFWTSTVDPSNPLYGYTFLVNYEYDYNQGVPISLDHNFLYLEGKDGSTAFEGA